MPVQEKNLYVPTIEKDSDKENTPPNTTDVSIPTDGEFSLGIDDLQPGVTIQFVGCNRNP